MKLKNILIVVSDIEKSRQFYHDLFGLETILDQDGNMILTEGLVLQEKEIWESVTGRKVMDESHNFELYFEDRDLDAFVRKLEDLYPAIRYITPLTDDGLERRIVRFYDLDGHLIEVAEQLY